MRSSKAISLSLQNDVGFSEMAFMISGFPNRKGHSGKVANSHINKPGVGIDRLSRIGYFLTNGTAF
jgi:hypothetical protein